MASIEFLWQTRVSARVRNRRIHRLCRWLRVRKRTGRDQADAVRFIQQNWHLGSMEALALWSKDPVWNTIYNIVEEFDRRDCARFFAQHFKRYAWSHPTNSLRLLTPQP